ncbi:MAG: hypothetical protein R2827_08970 [Bdellovibrionales bacterium]
MGHGGFSGLRGAYEYSYHRTYSVGGVLHIEPKDEPIPSISVIHGFLRPHFYQRTWDLYVSPGFGIAIVDDGTNDETVIGPSLAFGVLYPVVRRLCRGVREA